MKAVTDAGIVFAREISPLLRSPLSLGFTMAEPLVFLFLFGPLLAGSVGNGGAPWQWFVPGILVMMAVFGTTSAGYGILVEISGGSLDRMLVTPVGRPAMLVGRTLKEVVQLLAQAVLIIAGTLPLGLTLYPAGFLAALLLLAVLGIGLGSLAFALALYAKRQQELFYGVQQVVLFPIVLLSGVLLPLDNAPPWLASVSRFNPVTYVVEAERALFRGDFNVWPGVVAALVLAVIGLSLGTRAMKRAAL